MENNNIMGLKFEFYVYNLYKNLKKRNVRHNKIIRVNKKKNNNIRVQIDIMYSSWFKDHYVECKYRKENTKVTLNEVAKFYAVLDLLKVPAKRGEIVTNNYFNDRAIIFLDERALIQKEIKDFFQIKQELSERQSLNDRLSFEKKYFLNWEKIQNKLDNFSTIIHDSFLGSGKKTYFDFSSQLQESLRGNLQLLKKKISFFHKQKLPNSQSYKICFLCDSSEQIERMADLFQDAEINLEQFNFLKLVL